MTGRGVDQILPQRCAPQLYEPHIENALDYVKLAEEAHGPIRRPVTYEYVWGRAIAELEAAAPHARIVNLETSVTNDGAPAPGKGIHYRMHPANVRCLSALRIDVCVLANNHVLDWGLEGLSETLATLHRAGIATAGAGRNLTEALQPATVALAGGGRVIVYGFGHGSSGVPASWAAGPGRPGVALLEELSAGEARSIARRIRATKRPGDLVVASVHWGSNWGYEVPDAHVRFAHALVDGGVDVVHGHSSHHPRPIEIYAGRLVLYGCGDLISDYEGIRGYEPFRDDLVLMYLPILDARDGTLIELSMTPMRIERMQLVPASGEERVSLTEVLSASSRPFGVDVVLSSSGRLVASPARAEA
jgi:poly-gamma-glutamate synthesis protein (capsule biosynthesis protein)